MFLPPPPFKRHSKAGLTILESLVLLIAAILLALVAVPVLLVKFEIIKQETVPILKEAPGKPAGSQPLPVPKPVLPEAPKLPPPADSAKP